MSVYSREMLLARLRKKIAEGWPVIAAGAGAGIVAKYAARAGVDLIMTYCTGPYRQNGNATPLGYMNYGDCNEISWELGRRVRQVAGEAAVIAGIGAADPYHRMDEWIDRLPEGGFSGVTNVPTVGGHDGAMRTFLERHGLGFNAEVELIRRCRKRDVFTAAYAFDEVQMRAMCAAGADVVAAHMGGTSGGAVGFPEGMGLEEAIERVQQLCRIAAEENPDTLVLCHGGPLGTPESVQRCLAQTDAAGYVGASSIERIPLERAVYETCCAYTGLHLRGAEAAEDA